MTTAAAQTTGTDGSYSFDVLAGVYVVTANGTYLGVITVGTDSPGGTLNDYLAGYDPSALTPEIVQTVEGLVKEAQEAATAAANSAASARTDATSAHADALSAAESAEQVLSAMNLSVNGISPDNSGNIQTYSVTKTLSSGVRAYTAVVENIDTEMVSMIANASFASSLTVDLSNFCKASPIYRLRLTLSVQEQYAPDGLKLIFTGVSKIWNDNGGGGLRRQRLFIKTISRLLISGEQITPQLQLSRQSIKAPTDNEGWQKIMARFWCIAIDAPHFEIMLYI